MKASAAPYFVHIAVFSTGERMPFVLHAETAHPVVLAMRYIIDVRRSHCQFSTLKRDASVLAALFTWAAEIGIDLDSRLRGGPEFTPAEVTSIARYLRSGRRTGSWVRLALPPHRPP